METRESKAFAVTPFATALLWYAYVLLMILVSDGHLDWGADVVAFLVGTLTYGLLVAFGLTYLVAVPSYLLLRATVGINGVAARSAGAAIGAITGVGLAYSGMDPGPIGGGLLGWLIAAFWWRMVSGAWVNRVTAAGSAGRPNVQ